MAIRIDWFNVGKDHWEGKQKEIEKICREIEWYKLPCTMAFCPGETIKTMIKENRIPKVSHVANSHLLAPYGLVGIRAQYKNADVEIFAVDEGTHISTLCAFVTEK